MQIGELLNAPDPLALQKALDERDKQMQKMYGAQQMAQGNYGAAGWAGVAGNLIGGLLARRNSKKADEASDKYLQQHSTYNKDLAAFKAQQEELKAQKARAEKIEEERRKHGYDLDLTEAKKQQTTTYRNLVSAGFQPGTPEFNQAMMAQLNKSNAPTVNIDNGKTNQVFAEKLAGKNAEKFVGWEDEAFASNEILGKLGQMKQISQAQSTGMMNEAMAMAGKWFGSDAGSNLQSYNAIQKDLMLDAAANLKGAMSDGEWNVLQAKMPDFGNDPRANQQIISILEGAAQRKIDRYNNASNYIDENGKLQGFRPKFGFSKSNNQPEQKEQEPNQQTKEINGAKYIQKDGKWYQL